jgi:hypothetical protein
MQTPIPDQFNSGRWGCLPNVGGGFDENGCYLGTPANRQPVNCDKWSLCMMGGVCTCDACACRNTDGAWTVDLARNGDRLDGTMGMGTFTMHLVEQPAS